MKFEDAKTMIQESWNTNPLTKHLLNDPKLYVVSVAGLQKQYDMAIAEGLSTFMLYTVENNEFGRLRTERYAIEV